MFIQNLQTNISRFSSIRKVYLSGIQYIFASAYK